MKSENQLQSPHIKLASLKHSGFLIIYPLLTELLLSLQHCVKSLKDKEMGSWPTPCAAFGGEGVGDYSTENQGLAEATW